MKSAVEVAPDRIVFEENEVEFEKRLFSQKWREGRLLGGAAETCFVSRIGLEI